MFKQITRFENEINAPFVEAFPLIATKTN